jgi:hypothetical protein
MNDASITTMLDSILDVAKAVGPLVGLNAESTAAADQVVNLVDHAIETFGGDQPGTAELIATRDELEAKVAQHVDRTVAALRADD